jgi:hypothetical protein
MGKEYKGKGWGMDRDGGMFDNVKKFYDINWMEFVSNQNPLKKFWKLGKCPFLKGFKGFYNG